MENSISIIYSRKKNFPYIYNAMQKHNLYIFRISMQP